MDAAFVDVMTRLTTLATSVMTERMEAALIAREDALQLMAVTITCGLLCNASEELRMCKTAAVDPDTWSEEMWSAYLTAAISLEPPANSVKNYMIICRVFPEIAAAKHALQCDKKLSSGDFRQIFTAEELAALVSSYTDETAGVDVRRVWAAGAALK